MRLVVVFACDEPRCGGRGIVADRELYDASVGADPSAQVGVPVSAVAWDVPPPASMLAGLGDGWAVFPYEVLRSWEEPTRDQPSLFGA